MKLSVKAAPGISGGVMLASLVVAHAQTPAAYDGTYVGVSATLLNQGIRETRSCETLKAPPTLTINGPIGPQGTIALQNDYKSRLNAQIDAQGNVTGKIGAQCTYDSVWRKR